MAAGAVGVVRSAQAEKEELLFILANSGSTALVVEDYKTLRKLSDRLHSLPIKLVVLLSDEELDQNETLKIVNYSALLAIGSDHPPQPVKQNREMLATLMYTSGTTGKPKGVMLSHGNLLHQVTTLGVVVQPQRAIASSASFPPGMSTNEQQSISYFLKVAPRFTPTFAK